MIGLVIDAIELLTIARNRGALLMATLLMVTTLGGVGLVIIVKWLFKSFMAVAKADLYFQGSAEGHADGYREGLEVGYEMGLADGLEIEDEARYHFHSPDERKMWLQQFWQRARETWMDAA